MSAPAPAPMSAPTQIRRWDGRLTRALVVERPDAALDLELSRLGITVERADEASDDQALVRLLQRGQHHLLFKRSRLQVTEEVLAASDDLAAVMLCCIGDDSVDKEAAARHGVLVMNDPMSNGRSVAELVIGELIVMSRRIFEAVSEMGGSVWRKNNKARYEVMGKRLGILGLGNIGRQVARLADSLGMEVLFHDSSLVSHEVGVAMGYQPCASVDELFRAADFVTVHVSATDVHGRSNEGLLSLDRLRCFAEGAPDKPRLFLNLARGVIVAPEDLRRAVEEGAVRYAITDVFPSEPGGAKDKPWVSPYQGEPRVFATPHIGAATMEAQPRIARYMARTTQLFSDFGMIRNCVFRPRSDIDFEVPRAGAMLAVVHTDKRGTKRAVDEAIFEAGASNLRSAHVDYPAYGVAYDLSALDQGLAPHQIAALVAEAQRVTGDPTAIRWVRTIPVEEGREG